jgi:hypothetical protein
MAMQIAANSRNKGNGKNKGKRREASLRQSGSAFGAAFIGRAEALPFRVELIGMVEVLPPSGLSLLVGLKCCPSG